MPELTSFSNLPILLLICVLVSMPCSRHLLLQEPGTEADIKKYAAGFGVKFDMFSKTDVNGGMAHPLYKYLKKQLPGNLGRCVCVCVCVCAHARVCVFWLCGCTSMCAHVLLYTTPCSPFTPPPLPLSAFTLPLPPLPLAVPAIPPSSFSLPPCLYLPSHLPPSPSPSFCYSFIKWNYTKVRSPHWLCGNK